MHNFISNILSLADYQTLNMRIEPNFQLIREPVTLSKVKLDKKEEPNSSSNILWFL